MEIILGIIIAIILIVITYFNHAFKYWKNRNLPYLEPRFPFGTSENPFRRKNSPGVSFRIVYEKLKAQGHKHGGIYLFSSPRYMPVHPEYIKNIMLKDFDHFVERGFYYNEKDDPLSANLFAIGGQKWRKLRTKLTPTFTSGKMKLMFDTLVQCGYQMQEAVDNSCKNKQEVDIKNVLACFTTDIIGSCAFGLDCNSFKNPNGEFRKYGKKIFDISKMRSLAIAFCFAKPNLARKLGVRFFSKDITDFFMNVVQEALKYRETNNINRNDMLQILIDLKNEGEGLTFEELAAQAFVFFFAGFETSSTTMTFCLYELARNKEIQQKVRDEIKTVLANHNGKITYDALMEMKYMDQVIKETLRKYPPLSFLTRECVKDYKIPETDITIEKGVHVTISVLGLHHNTDYYPNSETFDPERFSEANNQSRPSFTYIPFGEGPRVCIGLRFGMMQTKVGLSVLLNNFYLSLNKKTTDPIELDPFGFILAAKSGVYLDVERINY